MSARQAPGGIDLRLKCRGAVCVNPVPSQGLFEIALAEEFGTTGHSVRLNRSELAAYHAAIGELLEFYRDEERP